jgi:hypothetical protein
VARIIRQLDIRCASRAKKRFTTKSDAAHVWTPGLVQRGDFSVVRPDAFWVADFTYSSTWSCIVHVAFIIDVFSRRGRVGRCRRQRLVGVRGIITGDHAHDCFGDVERLSVGARIHGLESLPKGPNSRLTRLGTA